MLSLLHLLRTTYYNPRLYLFRLLNGTSRIYYLGAFGRLAQLLIDGFNNWVSVHYLLLEEVDVLYHAYLVVSV